MAISRDESDVRLKPSKSFRRASLLRKGSVLPVVEIIGENANSSLLVLADSMQNQPSRSLIPHNIL